MLSNRTKILGILIISVAVLSGVGLYYVVHTGTESQTVTIIPDIRTATSEKTPTNILLIGWDGAQRDHLREMVTRGQVPNLIALAVEGRLVDIDITTGATDTKAGWAQILTGYAPAKTGVFSNSRYQPIPIGYTVFERLETFFGPENIVTAAIIGKKGNVDDDGPTKIPFDQWAQREIRQGNPVPQPRPGMTVREGGKIIEENGTLFVTYPGKPYFYTKNYVDTFLNGLNKNERVGAVTLENLEKYREKQFFFFIHFAEPDHAGHAHGENSREYTEAVKSDDEWTGKIVAKLRELGLYEKTLVYITADHGFDEGKTTHSNAPFVFLATNDPRVNRNGDRADITPTILKRFSLDLSKIEPPLDGIPLDEPANVRRTHSGAGSLRASFYVIAPVVCSYSPKNQAHNPFQFANELQRESGHERLNFTPSSPCYST